MHYSISAEGSQIAREYLNELTTVNGNTEAKPCCEKYARLTLK